MKGFERHQYDLVLNTVPDRKPMGILWDGCDVVIATGSDHNASCHSLDSLQIFQYLIRYIIKEAISIVQSRYDKGVNQ